jgi:plastocyanin
MRPRSRLPFLVLLAAAVSCGGGGGGGPTGNNTGNVQQPPPGTPNSVIVNNNSFSPTDLNVAKGATVTWTWNSCSGGDSYGTGEVCVAHNVAFDDAVVSGSQSAGTFTRTFDAAGTFPYHCAIHGAAMSGKVVVQ